jgi:hypothetical protein
MRPLVILLVLVAGLVGFLLGYSLRDPDVGSAETSAPGEADAVRAEISELRDSCEDLERRLEEATVRYREAEAALAGPLLPPEGAEERREAAPPPVATDREDTGAFFMMEYEGALRRVDWETVGTNLSEIVDLLRDGAPRLLRREPLPPDVGTRIQRLNSPVLAAAIKVRDFLPGTGVNGKFSSAPFMLNAIASTLAAAGKPLTEHQSRRLLEIGRDLLSRDERRRSEYGPDTYALAQLVDDMELKGGFFESVYEVLDSSQASVLHSEPARDRVRLDLFSSAIALSGRVEVLTFADEADLVQRLGSRVVRSLGCSKDQLPQAGQTIRRWAAGIPRELLNRTWNALDERGMVHADRAVAWAGQLLELLRALSTDLAFEGRQARTARGVGNVLVGLMRGRGTE